MSTSRQRSLSPSPPDQCRTVVINGYHATSEDRVINILQNGFNESQNEEDWLGDGIYFWQDAPHRAWTWARASRQRQPDRIGDRPVVIGARIVLPLEQTIDFLDSSWAPRLNQKYWQLVHKFISEARDPAEMERFFRQTGDLERPVPRKLDRFVINGLVADIVGQELMTVTAVRAAFPEGPRVYPDSGIRTQSHVQLAVRDYDCIDAPDDQGKRMGLWLEPEPHK